MRVGLLIPSSNVIAEEDYLRAGPPGWTVHASRAHLAEVGVDAERRMVAEHVDRAVEDMATMRPDAAVFVCTTAGAMLGGGEGDLVGRIETDLGCPVVSTNQAVQDTLAELRATRISVVSPYTDALAAQLRARFVADGFDVMSMAGMGISAPMAIADVEPEQIVAFVRRHPPAAGSQALFLSCANLRAFEVRAELERELGIPVVTSNQATLRRLCGRLGVTADGVWSAVDERAAGEPAATAPGHS